MSFFPIGFEEISCYVVKEPLKGQRDKRLLQGSLGAENDL